MEGGYIFQDLQINTDVPVAVANTAGMSDREILDAQRQATTVTDRRIMPCPPRTYQDELNQTQCKNCPAGFYTDGSATTTCIERTASPTHFPTTNPTSAPLAFNETAAPTPAPSPLPAVQTAWFTKRELSQSWITVETIFKIVRTHVFYKTQAEFNLFQSTASGGSSDPLGATFNGCEGSSDPFFNVATGKIESPCEQSMGYLYEATLDNSWDFSGGGTTPVYRLLVQCITWDMNLYPLFSEGDISNPLGAWQATQASPLLTGGMGMSPGRRTSAGTNEDGTATNGCNSISACGSGGDGTTNWFSGCTWRKNGSPFAYGDNPSAGITDPFNAIPFPNPTDWELYKRSACVVTFENGMYLSDSHEIDDLSTVYSSRGCSEACDALGYSAMQWSFDSQTSVAPSRCICLTWKQFSFSFEDFIKKATYNTPSCGIWAKAELEHKFSSELTVIDETYKPTATDCAEYCNFFTSDGLVFEPRPFSKYVSETPVCSCVNLTAPATWASINRDIFSECSEIWKKVGDAAITNPSQRCNTSSDLYEPFMEDTVNLNSHILPQLEVLGQLAVNTIPSKKIGAFLTPAIRLVDLGAEVLRAVARLVTSSIEAVWEPYPQCPSPSREQKRATDVVKSVITM